MGAGNPPAPLLSCPPRRGARIDDVKVIGLRLLFLALILLAWQITAERLPPGLFATPLATLSAARRLFADGELTTALLASLRVYLLGTISAGVVGIVVGVLMGVVRPLGRMLDIFVYALAATPRVAFVPLIIVLLGLGVEAKAFIVFMGAVMPVILNAYTGVSEADPDLMEMARATGASPGRIFLHVILPGSLPILMVGLRLGATIGLINTVVAELYTAVTGLGGLLAIYGNSFRMAEYFVVVLTLSLVGVAVTETLRHLENRLTRWRTASAR